MKAINSPRAPKLFSICFLLLFTIAGYGQVGIGTTTPNSNALLDIDASVTMGGVLLPRVALSSSAGFAPLGSHVAGMTVYNTATTADIFPGIYTNNGSRWVRVEDSSPAAHSVSLATDIQISSATFANVPSMPTLTFTARKTSVLVMLTASGIGYTNSMAAVQLRVRNVTSGTTIGGTNNKIQSYDDVTGTVTTWSASFSQLVTGLTIGTTYTFSVQGLVGGILGTPNAAIFPVTSPDNQHMTLTVIQ
ncbi:MAG: hypothetical protein DWP94_11660 [Flavobacterium sp.]|nr:MAG: hypothetical protein DWP94_11660 [Flavobacterium sp.]